MPGNGRLDTERAAYAAERINQGSMTGEALKKYRSAVNNAPAYLRQCGLLQLAAFYGSGKDRRPVWDDLWGWLTQASTTRVLLNSASNASSLSQQIDALSALSSHELAFLEREAEAIIGWLTRLTEAKYKEEERSAGNKHSRTQESASGETSGGEEGAEYA